MSKGATTDPQCSPVFGKEEASCVHLKHSSRKLFGVRLRPLQHPWKEKQPEVVREFNGGRPPCNSSTGDNFLVKVRIRPVIPVFQVGDSTDKLNHISVDRNSGASGILLPAWVPRLVLSLQ